MCAEAPVERARLVCHGARVVPKSDDGKGSWSTTTCRVEGSKEADYGGNS